MKDLHYKQKISNVVPRGIAKTNYEQYTIKVEYNNLLQKYPRL